MKGGGQSYLLGTISVSVRWVLLCIQPSSRQSRSRQNSLLVPSKGTSATTHFLPTLPAFILWMYDLSFSAFSRAAYCTWGRKGQ